MTIIFRFKRIVKLKVELIVISVDFIPLYAYNVRIIRKKVTKVGENQRIEFVNNLLHYMNLRGVSQADIVVALGVSSSTVSDWTKGKKYPRVDSMQRLADFLGVRMSDLVGSTEEKNPLDPDEQELMELREEYRNNPDFRTLFRLTRKCNPKALKQMNAIMQALTDTYKD